MKVIEKNIETSIIEKKSKFIANIFYIENIEEAENYINMIKKKYYNAKHNCFAYRILNGNNIYEKYSDDGEPNGTAGMPILDILRGKKLINIIVIVTRYFGGILLGTGGLVRAYSQVTNNALEKIKTIDIEEGFEIKIEIEYKDYEIFVYYCKINNINIIKKDYEENIKIIIETNENCKREIIENSKNIKFKILNSQILSKKLIRKIS